MLGLNFEYDNNRTSRLDFPPLFQFPRHSQGYKGINVFRFFELQSQSSKSCHGSVSQQLTTSSMASNRLYIMWGSYYDQIFLHGVVPLGFLAFYYVRWGTVLFRKNKNSAEMPILIKLSANWMSDFAFDLIHFSTFTNPGVIQVSYLSFVSGFPLLWETVLTPTMSDLPPSRDRVAKQE